MKMLGLLGVTARPTDTLRLNADLMFGYNDNSFTRISPRQVQSYKIQCTLHSHAVGEHRRLPWTSTRIATTYPLVNNMEHGRTYSFVATLSPNAKLWVDFGYNYMDIYTQTEICFPDTGSTVFTTPCPVPGASSPLGTLSSYSSQDNYAYGDVMWKPLQARDRHAGIWRQHRSRQHDFSQSADADRHAGFQLPQAACEPGV